MHTILRLGPVPLSTETTNVYLRVADTGALAPPVFHRDDVEAVRELLGDLAPAAVQCEPTLREAAETLSLAVSEPPLSACEARAAIAVFVHWGRLGLTSMGSDRVVPLLDAAKLLWEAAPWAWWSEGQAIGFEVSGTLERRGEAALLGNAGVGYGLALYDEPGAIERIESLERAGDAQAARATPAIAVTLDEKPPYVVEALYQAGRLGRVPIPLKTGPAGLSAPDPEDALLLLAAMQAAAKLGPGELEPSAEVRLGGHSIRVVLRAPPPAAGAVH